MEKRSCKSCRFALDTGDPQEIVCRRYPPTFDEIYQGREHFAWIKTRPEDWCGEYKPQSPQKVRGKTMEGFSANEEALFQGFWEAYPRKENRPGAARKWIGAVRSGVAPGEIFAGLLRYKATQQVREGKFVQHAATWLNQEGWKVTYDTPAQHRAAPLVPWEDSVPF